MMSLNATLKEMGTHVDELIAVGVIGRDGMLVAEYNPAGINMEGVYARFSMILMNAEESVAELEALGNFEDNVVIIQTAKVKVLTRLLGPQYFLSMVVDRACPLSKVLKIVNKYQMGLRKEI